MNEDKTINNNEEPNQESSQEAQSVPVLIFQYNGIQYEWQCSTHNRRPLNEVLSLIRSFINVDAALSLKARISSKVDYLDEKTELAVVLSELQNDSILIIEGDLHKPPDSARELKDYKNIEADGVRKSKAGGFIPNKKENEAFTKVTTISRDRVKIVNLGLMLLPEVMMPQLRGLQNDRALKLIHLFAGVFIGAFISMLIPYFDGDLSPSYRGFLIGGIIFSLTASISLLVLDYYVTSQRKDGWESIIKMLSNEGAHEGDHFITASSDSTHIQNQTSQKSMRIRIRET